MPSYQRILQGICDIKATNTRRHFPSQSYHMADAFTAPPAVAAAVLGFVSVATSVAKDATRRPARPLKRSRKDQAAETGARAKAWCLSYTRKRFSLSGRGGGGGQRGGIGRELLRACTRLT